METLTSVEDIKPGSLLHRADGRVFYIIQEINDHFLYFARNTSGYMYVSLMKRQHSFQNEKFKYSIDRIHNNVPTGIIAEALSDKKMEADCFDKLLSTAVALDKDSFTIDKQEGPKSEIKDGAILMDRYRSLYYVHYVDGDDIHVIVLNNGHSNYSDKHRIFKFSEFRNNLKHSFARHGIQIVLASNDAVGAGALLSDGEYGNITNDMINEAKGSVRVDLRTRKDLGDKKIPHYKHKLWLRDEDEVIYGTMSKKLAKRKSTEPTYEDERKLLHLMRKFPEFAQKSALTDEEFKIYIHIKDKKKITMGNIVHDFNYTESQAKKVLDALTAKKYIVRSHHQKSETNICYLKIY